MLLEEYDYETDIEVQREEAYQIGEQTGRNKGREEGRQEEKEKFSKLTHCLFKDGRLEELTNAMDDPKIYDKLLEEYGII